MTDWAKLVEALRNPLPFSTALALSLLTAILVFSPEPFLRKLGIASNIETYRPWMGLIFLLSACWMLVTGILALAEASGKKWRDSRAVLSRRRRLHKLTRDEKECLRYFFTIPPQRTAYLGETGVLQGLVDDGLLYKPSMQINRAGVAYYNILDWVLEYLAEHPELLADDPGG